MKSKIKSLAIILVTIALAVGSFMLGRLSISKESPKEPVIIEQEEIPLVESPKEGTGSFVASKNGSRYYPLGCAGVKRIKEENKIYFNSKEEAEAVGYTPAAGC